MPAESAAHTAAAIGALLRPRSIAIAGASADRGKLGSLPLEFLRRHGFPGSLYPINPGASEIAGLKCHASPAEIDSEIDLLVVAVAASRVPQLLQQCRPGQVKSALILSSGYAEIGAEGEVLQCALRAQAAAAGLRFVGPNSVGLANVHDKVVPSISQVFDQPELRPGPIAFVTQSGAVGTAITALAHRERLGIGYFVSTGNEGDLEFSDFCEYFAADPAVKIIGGYLESVRDGARFLRAMKRATSAGKPVILIKVGTTEVGERAVRSHTGALAGAEEAYRLAFRESGVLRASSIEELIDLLKVFSVFPDMQREMGRAPASKPRVAVLSHSGGSGVLVGDACAAEGLELPAPSAALAGRLRARLPAFAALQNPIDMTAGVVLDPALMGAVVRDTMESAEYDAVLLCVNLIWRQGKALAGELVQAQQASPTPLAVAWVAGKPEAYESLAQSGVPAFTDPVRCARAVASRLLWQARREAISAEAAPVSTPAPVAAGDLRRFAGQQALLDRYRIPQAPASLATDAAGAQRAAWGLGYPVAAKLVATDVLHKSDAGAVVLGIASDTELERAVRALEALPAGGKEGFLVQRMVSGLELFAGFKRDVTFGPVVVFGLGGIYVEVLKETVMALAPFGREQAAKLIESARFYPLLSGARGRPPCDVASLAHILSQLSILAIEQPHVQALDLNPIMARADGAIVVDAKLELQEHPIRHRRST